MNKIVKDALILFAITLVAGVLLGFVYDITKDPIAAQNEKAKQEAYKEVMADADSFEALSGDAYSEANITATFAAALQVLFCTRYHIVTVFFKSIISSFRIVRNNTLVAAHG